MHGHRVFLFLVLRRSRSANPICTRPLLFVLKIGKSRMRGHTIDLHVFFFFESDVRVHATVFWEAYRIP